MKYTAERSYKLQNSGAYMTTEMGYVRKFIEVHNFKPRNKHKGWMSWTDYRGNIITLADVMDIVNNMSFKDLEALGKE